MWEWKFSPPPQQNGGGLYCGCFGHALLCATKMIVSACRRLRCLSTCQKQNSSFTSSLRYYILKIPAILLADSIWNHNWRPRILPGMGLLLNINNNISFHFRLFPRKTNDKILLYFGAILAFLPKFGQNEFSWKKEICQFLNIPVIYDRVKTKKTNLPFLRKLLNWQMDGQTDRRTDRKPWFCRTLCRIRMQLSKSNFKLSWI